MVTLRIKSSSVGTILRIAACVIAASEWYQSKPQPLRDRSCATRNFGTAHSYSNGIESLSRMHAKNLVSPQQNDTNARVLEAKGTF